MPVIKTMVGEIEVDENTDVSPATVCTASQNEEVPRPRYCESRHGLNALLSLLLN